MQFNTSTRKREEKTKPLPKAFAMEFAMLVFLQFYSSLCLVPLVGHTLDLGKVSLSGAALPYIAVLIVVLICSRWQKINGKSSLWNFVIEFVDNVSILFTSLLIGACQWYGVRTSRVPYVVLSVQFGIAILSMSVLTHFIAEYGFIRPDTTHAENLVVTIFHNLIVSSMVTAAAFLVFASSVLLLRCLKGKSIAALVAIDISSSLPCTQGAGSIARIAHFSDLHVRSMNDKPIKGNARHTPISNTEIQRALGLAVDQAPDAIVLSGDITDTGSEEAWHLLKSWPEMKRAKNHLIVTPGNHDLNAVEPSPHSRSVTRAETTPSPGYKQRALRYLDFADWAMGSRTYVVCPFGQTIETLEATVQRVRENLGQWCDGELLPKDSMPIDEAFERCFPMLVFPVIPESGQQDRRIGYLVWNSVKPCRWPVLNALGEITEAQMQRGDKLLASHPDLPIVHVVHHHVGLPTRQKSFFRWPPLHWTALGMVMSGGPAFVRWLSKRSAQTILLHGHHHRAFAGKAANSSVHVISAPSVAHPCEGTLIKGIRRNKAYWLTHEVQYCGREVMPVSLRAEEAGSSHVRT
jgi:hypothetical protein